VEQKSEEPGVSSEARWQMIYALRIAGLPNPWEESKACL